MKPFYITTTLPYVNAEPHIGFAMEIVTADAIARYQRQQGREVVFNTGTDEHGLKIYQQASLNNQDPKEYSDFYAAKFLELKKLLNLSFTNFIRTTDEHHERAAKEFWKRCEGSGDIYKKLYKVKYCIGCELEKTESELKDGRCPLHPQRDLEMIEEENYFFRFSKYREPLLDWYEKNPEFVRPDQKMKEIISFVDHGLKDFSISRLRSKLPWGIPVPNDPDQVMYVWFDALINYISTLGWPDNQTVYDKYWPGIQIAGKDNLRQQAAMWQAMLMSAKLPPSKQILINGFISVDGQKMSKSLNNVISPAEMVDRFGVDATRYLLLVSGPVSGDIDVTWKKYDEWYNAYLANSLGNTVQRIATLCARSDIAFPQDQPPGYRSQVKQPLENYRFDLSLAAIWDTLHTLEKRIDEVKPWTLEKQPLKIFLIEAVAHMRQIGYELHPFMPDTSAAIGEIFKGPRVTLPKPLFPRLVLKSI